MNEHVSSADPSGPTERVWFEANEVTVPTPRAVIEPADASPNPARAKRWTALPPPIPPRRTSPPAPARALPPPLPPPRRPPVSPPPIPPPAKPEPAADTLAIWLGQDVDFSDAPYSDTRSAEVATPSTRRRLYAVAFAVVAIVVVAIVLVMRSDSESTPAKVVSANRVSAARVSPVPAAAPARVAAEPPAAAPIPNVAAPVAVPPTPAPVSTPAASTPAPREKRPSTHRAKKRERTPHGAPSARSKTQVGTLRIATTPSFAIAIDGKPTGLRTPQDALALQPGAHRLTLTREGETRTIEITIAAGKTTQLVRDFAAR